MKHSIVLLLLVSFSCRSKTHNENDRKSPTTTLEVEAFSILSALKAPTKVSSLILREASRSQIDSLSLLGEMPNLKILDLSMANLGSFPKMITEFKSLERLELNYNYLEEIPNSISNLKNLKRLGLLYNNFTEIPSSLCTLRNLEYINLNGNQIESYPNCLYALEKLKVLQIAPKDENDFLDSLTIDRIKKLLPKNCVVISN